MQRESVSQKVTDFSSLVTKVPSDADVVFLPWQVAANGQLFAQQMLEQGKKAKIFGSDGLDSGRLHGPGRVRLVVRPDIRGLPGTQGDRRRVRREVRHEVGTFGPPTYCAVQVALTAIKAACADGKASACRDRQERPKVEDPALDPRRARSASTQGPRRVGAKFYISQIQRRLEAQARRLAPSRSTRAARPRGGPHSLRDT